MKYLATPYTSLITLLVTFTIGGLAQAGNSNAGARKKVAALESQWLRSDQTNDIELARPLMADGFVNTWTDGKVTDKMETLAEAKVTHWSRAEYENLKVAVFRDTAIATGGFIGQGTASSGKAFDVHSRFTDTWVKMADGRWRCVASHGSIIK